MIQEKLFEYQDLGYREFNSKLIPNIDKETMIGVRIPDIRKIEKSLSIEEKEQFLMDLPHKYFEENMLHGIIISNMKDYNKVITNLEKFLPYVDNWAVCDSISPKILKKNREKVITNVLSWIKSNHTYVCRFGIGMIMQLYLEDEYFKKSYLDIIAEIKTEDYYINMMRAWTFQVALVKQWKEAILYIEKGLLDEFTHNKTISKSCDSYKIEKEKKEYLKTLRRREK
ncbi:MAG: DNA alkylation repair protein [Clostridiales bacterium]|nr:DNA alkylation repair protein [Clostridiales bacterium]